MSGVSATGLLAGCLGETGASNPETTTGTQQPAETTSEQSVEEWRAEMAEKAKEELKDEKLQVWSESVYDAEAQSVVFNGHEGKDTRMVEAAPIIDPGEPWEVLKDSVEVIPLNSQDQAQTYRRMVKTGSVTKDILTTSKLPEMLQQGVPVTDLSSIPTWHTKVPKRLQEHSTKVAYYRSRVSGVFYNEETVSDPPENILDLLEPRFSDKRIIVDVSSNVVKLLPFVSDEYKDSVPPRLEALGSDMTGMEFVEKLGEQNPLYGTSSFDMTQTTARGDADITFMGPLSVCYDLMVNEDMPITPLKDPTGHHIRPLGLGIAKDAPHPAASKLFIDYVLSNPSVQLYEKGALSLDMTESHPKEAASWINADWQRQYSTFDAKNDPSVILDRWKDAIGAPSV